MVLVTPNFFHHPWTSHALVHCLIHHPLTCYALVHIHHSVAVSVKGQM